MVKFFLPSRIRSSTSSHVGTGRRCRLFKFGFDPKVSAILVTADVIVDIDDVKASKVSEFVEDI